MATRARSGIFGTTALRATVALLETTASPVLVAFVTGCILSGCILDFDGLAGGGSTSSSGTTSAGGASSSGGSTSSGGSGGAACGPLDCCDAAPVELVGPGVASSPRGLVARKDGLYWANFGGDAILRLPADGGPAETLATAVGPRGVAAWDDRLVWTARDGVYACTLPACADAAVVVPSLGVDSLRAVAFDGVTLAFTDRGAADYDGRARSCALDACEPLDLHDGMLAPEGIVLDGSHATWTESGNGNMNGSVWRSPKDQAGAMQVAWSLTFASGVAVDDGYVYWTEQASAPEGHVTYCTLGAQGCVTRVAEGPFDKPSDLLVAGGSVVWTNLVAGTIASCPAPTCGAAAPKEHVTGRIGLAKIAVNATCIFWGEDAGGGAIYKVAR